MAKKQPEFIELPPRTLTDFDTKPWCCWRTLSDFSSFWFQISFPPPTKARVVFGSVANWFTEYFWCNLVELNSVVKGFSFGCPCTPYLPCNGTCDACIHSICIFCTDIRTQVQIWNVSPNIHYSYWNAIEKWECWGEEMRRKHILRATHYQLKSTNLLNVKSIWSGKPNVLNSTTKTNPAPESPQTPRHLIKLKHTSLSR